MNTVYSLPEKRQYPGIDLIKFLCAFLIFTIHIPPFQGAADPVTDTLNFGIRNTLCRVAVPFYFICSGFFLFRKMPLDQINTEVIKKYCFRIMQLLGIWYLLSFVGSVVHLWYLRATLTAVVILSLCLHWRFRLRNLYIFAAVMYIFGLLGDSYYGLTAPLREISVINALFKLYSRLFRVTHNGLFMGFIYVLMGATFAHKPIKLKPVAAAIGFVLSLGCLVGEVYLLHRFDTFRDYNMYIFALPAAFFLFAFACNVSLKDRPVYRRLRTAGMFLYFTHIMVEYFIRMGLLAITKLLHIDLLPYIFPITLTLSLMLAFGLEWLSRKEKFRFLTWLV